MPSARREVITLRAPFSDDQELQFVDAEVIPSRAMMVYQVRAQLPGRGEIDVLAAPPLEAGLARLSGGPDDYMGNASFSMGAAFLAPFVNRIRGRQIPEQREIETEIGGRRVLLPANGGGKVFGAEQYAIHGLILDWPTENIQRFSVEGGEAVSAKLCAGDFGGRWLSKTEFEFRIELTRAAFAATVRAANIGQEPLPIGLGWHPYFNIPSGDRTQARMRLPARARLPVNNYDEVLPTGEVLSVAGTIYDFSAPEGRALADLYLDDCFVELRKNAAGETVCELLDPAVMYGLRLVSDSPQITALQTFAPPSRPLLVIEPQFSWADPYGAQWPKWVDTGMVMLQPGHAVEYRVKLELFRL